MLAYAREAPPPKRPRPVSARVHHFAPHAFRAWREEHNIRRSDLRRLAGISTETVRRWEEALASPTIDALATCVSAMIREVAQDAENTSTGPAAARDELMAALIPVPAEAEKFSHLRNLAGMNQTQAAAAAGTSTFVYGQIERGEKPLTDELAAVFARVFQKPEERVRAAHKRTQNRKAGEPA